MRQIITICFIIFAPELVFAAPPEITADTLVASGKRLYQQGELLNQAPLRATVVGDVALRGEKIACISCHRRSGLGSVEGKILTPAITGDILFQPKKTARQQRAAYTDETLARAIRAGLDPAEHALQALMPRYVLEDQDMNALIAYLKTLSSGPAPGITGKTIYFASVITEEVKPEARQAMLEVLQKFIADKNGETRQETTRAKARISYVKKNHYLSYRKWVLSTWVLKGPADTWRGQLEKYYQQQPVFALLSGISTQSWEPIHRFCEDLAIPCLLPLTNKPVTAAADFYTLYFSRGLALEAEVIAKFLGERSGQAGPGQRIVQVFHNDADGQTMARAFRAAWKKNSKLPLEDQVFARDQKFNGGFWKRFAARVKPSVLLLWLPASDLAGLEDLTAKTPGAPTSIYLSSSLMGDSAPTLAASVRDKIYMAYAYNLPYADKAQFPREESWLRGKKIISPQKIIQAKTLLACTVAGEALMHVENIFSREYFLERIEHMLDSSAVSSVYPKISLGPDQRFAVKGAYIVKIGASPNSYIPENGWIIP